MSIYQFTVKDSKNNDVSLKDYKGKVLLIVNTATRCGFTPTYTELEKLYKEFKDQGFEILDFPCNQFGNQAPEGIDEINSICSLKFGTTFKRFAKIDVNGEHEIPLYTYLKSKQGFAGFDKNHKLTPILIDIKSKEDPNWDKNSSIKWNFTKFLISKTGEVVKRFEPTAPINEIEKAVKEELSK